MYVCFYQQNQFKTSTFRRWWILLNVSPYDSWVMNCHSNTQQFAWIVKIRAQASRMLRINMNNEFPLAKIKAFSTFGHTWVPHSVCVCVCVWFGCVCSLVQIVWIRDLWSESAQQTLFYFILGFGSVSVEWWGIFHVMPLSLLLLWDGLVFKGRKFRHTNL